MQELSLPAPEKLGSTPSVCLLEGSRGLAIAMLCLPSECFIHNEAFTATQLANVGFDWSPLLSSFLQSTESHSPLETQYIKKGDESLERPRKTRFCHFSQRLRELI